MFGMAVGAMIPFTSCWMILEIKTKKAYKNIYFLYFFLYYSLSYIYIYILSKNICWLKFMISICFVSYTLQMTNISIFKVSCSQIIIGDVYTSTVTMDYSVCVFWWRGFLVRGITVLTHHLIYLNILYSRSGNNIKYDVTNTHSIYTTKFIFFYLYSRGSHTSLTHTLYCWKCLTPLTWAPLHGAYPVFEEHGDPVVAAHYIVAVTPFPFLSCFLSLGCPLWVAAFEGQSFHQKSQVQTDRTRREM